jgi:hypothetical protein
LLFDAPSNAVFRVALLRKLEQHLKWQEGLAMSVLVTRRGLLLGSTALAIFVCRTDAFAQSVSAVEARAIAKDATIYGLPLLENYRIQYSYFVNRSDPDFKAPWNTLAPPFAKGGR